MLASLAAHLAGYAWLHWAWQLPDAGFELVLPSTIELGVVEGSQLVAPPPAAPEPAASEPAPPGEAAQAPAPKPGDAEATPPPPTKPVKPKPPRAPASARAAVAAHGLAAVSPPGAQLALRVDLDRVRSSVLAGDVQELLAAVPDVRAILDGSEIDPVRDLSRLFLASPNLQRSKLVLAGKYRGDDSLPRRAAENLARARGTTLEWQSQGTIPVVAWENPDSTERVLALIGPQLFTITRADDLPRVLGIAHALAERQARAGRARKGSANTPTPTDALLEMPDGQVVTFTVENAKLFARGATQHVPERLTVSVAAPEDARVRLRIQADFAGEPQAEAAQGFWTRLRDQYARSPILALLGFGGLLERVTLTRQGSQLEALANLRIEETRLMLRLVRDALGERRGAAVPRAARDEPDAPPAPAP